MNKALLQQALDVLDGAEQMNAARPERFDIELTAEQIDTLSAAIRAELAKPEPFAPDWANYRQGKDDALAEFSQEPVAWMNRSDEILPTFHRTKEAAAYWGDNPIPLYTKGTPNV